MPRDFKRVKAKDVTNDMRILWGYHIYEVKVAQLKGEYVITGVPICGCKVENLRVHLPPNISIRLPGEEDWKNHPEV